MSAAAKWSFRRVHFRAIISHINSLTFFFGILFGIGTAIFLLFEPRSVPFSLTDPTISYPYNSNTIPAWLSVVLPVLLAIIYWSIFEFYLLRDANGSLTVALFAVANIAARMFEIFLVVAFLQQSFAILSGQLRPNFLAACQYDPATGECTGDPHTVKDARKTYFSGHSSAPTVIAVYTALYLFYAYYYRLKQLPASASPTASERQSRPDTAIGFKATIARELKDAAVWIAALLPLLWAAYCGMSRVIDYQHSRQDVVTGFYIGFCFSSIYFPRYVFLNEKGIAALKKIVDDERTEGPDVEKGDISDQSAHNGASGSGMQRDRNDQEPVHIE